MLRIKVTISEDFDDEKQQFVDPEYFDLELEHSLASLSKWESIYEKPFLSSEKTTEETLHYVQLMIQTEDVPSEVLQNLSKDNFEAINEYIGAKRTATTFRQQQQKRPSREVLTSELIYYWMFSLNIPIECENWHLNRLLTLIRIFNIKNQPPKKTNRRDLLRQQAETNRINRERLKTTG